MKIFNFNYFICFFFAFIITPSVWAEGSDPSREWKNRPWMLRYVIFLSSNEAMKKDISSSKKFNKMDGKNGKKYIYHDIYELFPTLKNTLHSKDITVATVVINFDTDGNVLSDQTQFSGLKGRLSQLDTFVLTRENDPEMKPYSFASWEQGIDGNIEFSPGLCTIIDSHRYEDDWKKNNSKGNVGCREWTAQLYRKDPYIDVTTYSKKGNFIGEVVGWARFEDGPTPIIGMQGKQWLCLHECPAGERPGVIADMQAWTRRHGFPMPVPPPKQPLYPNKDYDVEYCQVGVEDSLSPAGASN